MELKLTTSVNSRAQGVSALLLALVVALVLASSMPSAMAQSTNGVKATYIEYNAPKVNWDLDAVSASCAALDEGQVAGLAVVLLVDGVLRASGASRGRRVRAVPAGYERGHGDDGDGEDRGRLRQT